MSFNDIAPSLSLIITIIGIPVSGYLSYHYAVKGAKVREWNDIAEPIHEYLEEHIELLSRQRCPDDQFTGFPAKCWGAVMRRISAPDDARAALKEYQDMLNEIRRNPAPAMYFGQQESEQEEWVDPYPTAVAKAAKLLSILSLR